jgi:hypothetical protein
MALAFAVCNRKSIPLLCYLWATVAYNPFKRIREGWGTTEENKCRFFLDNAYGLC